VDNEIEIIKRIKSGYTDDFRLLVEKYHRHLLNFIYRLVLEKNNVEDIGQETFVASEKQGICLERIGLQLP
jgi:DNA-directed RNA polymerase specialized sigma24 family protein